MPVNATLLLTLLSAASGAIGTGILFANSYSLQPLEAVGGFYSEEKRLADETIKAKNNASLIYQRVGLAFLSASFLLQAITAFTP